jgi:tetrahydromethanopterin S-methyltransferase subunit B
MANSNEPRVKVYNADTKPDQADSSEAVGTKRATPMIGTIIGLVLVIILAVILIVNLLR